MKVNHPVWRLAGLAAIPAIIGAGAAITLQSGLAPNPVLYLRADQGTLLLLVGSALSVIVSLTIVVWLSERRRALISQDAQQRQARERRLKLFQRIRHEISQPLTAAHGALENLEAAPDPVGRRQKIEAGRIALRRASAVVDELRKLADVERRPLDRETIRVNELLEGVVDFAREQHPTAAARLDVSVPRAWPLPTIRGDHDLLFMAVYNVVENALKFTPESGAVDVRATRTPGQVVIEIADNGRGIPSDEVTDVFDDLFRGRDTYGTPGTGIGLALVKTIIERHGGTVGIDSRLGYGTSITLRLAVT